MNRYLQKTILQDALADKKMAFVSGPRQVGKTTMGKNCIKHPQNYFSWDQSEFRRVWTRSPEKALESREEGPILLDEIHKDRKWKTRLKGVYDVLGNKLPVIVTGSARLDIYRKGSDSLLGRYLPYRLHPFSVAETDSPIGPDDILSQQKVSHTWHDLLHLGGFPEPLLSGRQAKAERWSRLRLDRLAYEDTRDIKVLSDLNAFRTLLDLIPEKIGSLFSFNSLREDVGVAYSTVREWVLLSEMLYYGFFIRPYAKGFKRAIRAEPKFYLYDLLQIPLTQKSQRLENLTALHLLKACHFWTDSGQGFFDLHFVRDKEKKEVDFLITREKKPWILIECKSNSKTIAPSLKYFSEKFETKFNFQLTDTKDFDRSLPQHGIRILSYEKFFSGWI